ncbi:hypothetical protein BIV57_10835 [Mangrovactinospora gilvigrisea]|uniref:GAF domain-containing protein n=1 Tax=Mangrovactinospora gilvigrisea TaxID=1428644 RepID=A0A1J7C7D2_9ACTN|nr:GAF domain-containing protein [Mangrovactinospora gilvigrisea]OIV37456.1 hypothetical protein BIV57_10835 [Mangrovactinospora gilvigrisea]
MTSAPQVRGLLSALRHAPGGLLALRRFPAQHCARILDLDAVTVSLQGAGKPELVWWPQSTPGAVDMEDLQYLLCEGPLIDAATHVRPVLVADLELEPQDRWPAFLAAPAPSSWPRSVAALPLTAQGIPIGVLTGYHRQPGGLNTQRLTNLQALARTISTMAGGAPAAVPGLHRAVVHQAAGALADHEGMPLADAAKIVCAHLFATGQPLIDGSRALIAHPEAASP